MKPRLYLINGPLGAGKTTFLKELLQQPGFKKARVIENEFASTSIDTHALHEHTAAIRTIAGVCICCGTGEALVETLRELKSSNEPVVIEATGVANSLKLIEKLAMADMFDYYTLAHGVFVLDAAEHARHGDALHTHAAELRAADTVLVSKTDLVTPEHYAALCQYLNRLGVRNVHKVVNGIGDFSLLEQPSGMTTFFANFDGELAAHDTGVNYMVMALDDIKLDPQKLHKAWPVLQRSFALRRLKGDGVSPDGARWHIEATPSQCRITKGIIAPAQLVAIGAKARELSLDTLKKMLV